MTAKLIVFDLDGTLTDSESTIYLSTVDTLAEYGIHDAITPEQMRVRIGAHFADIFNDLNIPVHDTEVFIKKYIVHYFRHMEGTFLYPGIAEVLASLRERDIPIALLTTKAQDQADLIIDYFKLREYFSLVMGRRPGFGVKPDPDALLYICSEHSIAPGDAVMVGDSEFDIRCGKNAGTVTVGCLYGFRSEEFIRSESPDYTISKPLELLTLPLYS